MDGNQKRAANGDDNGNSGHGNSGGRAGSGGQEHPDGAYDPNARHQEVTESLGRLAKGLAEHRVELRTLSGTVGKVSGQVGSLEGRLGQVTDEVSALRSHLTRVEEGMRGIQDELRRSAVKADARAERDRLVEDRRRRFGQREEIRGLARSLVDTFTEQSVQDGLIPPEVIKKCVSESLLYESRFWLAPALAHVAATYSGQAELSHTARGNAMRLDKSKAYLFIILTAARMKNYRLAGSTMDPYLDSIHPSRLTQDFLVVLEATANRELGPQAEKYALRRMERWFTEAPAASDGAARARERRESWRAQMWNKRIRMPQDDYAALRNVYRGDWPALVQAFEHAAVAEGTLAYLSGEFPEQPAPRSAGRHMDSALEHLISRLEPDEAELQAKIDWQQLLIDTGDVEVARRERELRRSVDAEVMTFEQLLDNAVFKPSQVELGTAARRLALVCVWRQIESVATGFVQESLRARPERLPIEIDDWRHTLPADPHSTVDERPLQSALAVRVEEATRRRVDGVHRRWPRSAAAVAGGGAAVLGFAAAQAWLVLTVLVAVAWGTYELWWVPAERRRREAAGLARRQETAQLLRQALDQRRQLFAQWEWYAGRLTALTGWLPPSGERST
ncbi:hypothetical protein [Streptomyces phaeoluteigriseus]